MRIRSRGMLTLRSTAVGTTLILAYEAEVVPIGRKRGTSVATESFHIHFLSSGILILMSQKKKKYISTYSVTLFTYRVTYLTA